MKGDWDVIREIPEEVEARDVPRRANGAMECRVIRSPRLARAHMGGSHLLNQPRPWDFQQIPVQIQLTEAREVL